MAVSISLYNLLFEHCFPLALWAAGALWGRKSPSQGVPGSIPALGKVPSLQGNNFCPPGGSGGTNSPALSGFSLCSTWILLWDMDGVVWIIAGGLGTEGTGPGRSSLEHLNTKCSGWCWQGLLGSPLQDAECDSRALARCRRRDVPGMAQSSAQRDTGEVGTPGGAAAGAARELWKGWGDSEPPFLGAGRCQVTRRWAGRGATARAVLVCFRFRGSVTLGFWMEPDTT